ncbi:FAD-dependent oxidoreductase [Rhodopirellula sp. SWK7]|uniref:FAD-dependent oxidoreductase n=1 Tax=Rhodopirellula sp. SWK7 TaxID=595460 RepID=UPI0011817C5C|nr:FAD-dependent oxidoreductase [Rhodopirellula sp. SWK7]
MIALPKHGGHDVVVIGAGLAGSCTALELARQGLKVALLDRDPTPMNRASRRNEGKIHLGLIYAADPTFATAELQLRGGLSFYPLLSRWIGDRVDSLETSSPFLYLVASDSILTPEQLQSHYEKVEQSYREQTAEDRSLTYLGTRPTSLARRIPLEKLDKRLNPSGLSAAFETNELAIDTDQLAEQITQAIAAHENIEFYAHHCVHEIDAKENGFVLSGESTGSSWSHQCEQVVNATWESRLILDATLGLKPPPGWLYRLKYRVLARCPDRLRNAPSTTMVLGRYGDVVMRPNGTAYLSWYPVGMQGWNDQLTPPSQWSDACQGDRLLHEPALADQIIDGIKDWYPDIANCTPYQLDAGAIVAYGNTDVDDPDSGLHDRTQVGVSSVDGYHSVDPGKLTTAPFFAMQAAERVLSHASQPVTASSALR